MLVEPFLFGEDFVLDGRPGSLKEFLLARRDSFIEWVDLYVSRDFADVLLELYNQVLEQLDTEFKVMMKGMAERHEHERTWAELARSRLEEVDSLEFKLRMAGEDHERVIAELGQLRSSLKKERAAFKSSSRDLKESLECCDQNFQKMKEHFDAATVRADRCEAQLHQV
jgi:hypothetical protein